MARGAKNPRAQATQLLRMPGTKILHLTLGGKEAGVGMGWKGELICSLGWRESKPMQVREPLLTLTLPPHLFRSLRRWLCQRTLFQASPSPRPCATFSPQPQECCLQAVSLTLTDMARLWTKGVPGYTPVGLTVQGWHLHLHSHRHTSFSLLLYTSSTASLCWDFLWGAVTNREYKCRDHHSKYTQQIPHDAALGIGSACCVMGVWCPGIFKQTQAPPQKSP